MSVFGIFFITNHSVETNTMITSVNIKTKLLRYVRSMSSALANKTETSLEAKN